MPEFIYNFYSKKLIIGVFAFKLIPAAVWMQTLWWEFTVIGVKGFTILKKYWGVTQIFEKEKQQKSW